MKLSLAFVTAGLAAFASVQGAAIEKRWAVADTTILNYALTLEYLEADFYANGLAKFSAGDFQAAGYEPFVRQRLLEIGEQEATHAATLKKALGKKATKPCEYTFPVTTVDDFLAVSRVLEAVGVSAYLGAAPEIESRSYLTVAASIYGVEARHQALVSQFDGVDGTPSAFETPLDFSQVYTLAAQFITKCPKSNPKLPVQAFPALTSSAPPAPGSTVTLNFPSKKGKSYTAHFLNGLNDYVVKINKNGQVKVPSNLEGQVYIIVTNNKSLSDKTTVAGPLPFAVVTPNA